MAGIASVVCWSTPGGRKEFPAGNRAEERLALCCYLTVLFSVPARELAVQIRIS